MSEFPVSGYISPRPFVPIAGSHREYTLGATFLTVNLPSGAKDILVQAVDQNIRMTLDGTNPTTTSGFKIVANDPPFIITLATVGQMTLKFAREAAGAILVLEFGA